MSVYEKLVNVQSELKAPKSKFNSFGKYNYRSLEDILEGVKPLLAKYKATLVIADGVEQVGDRYYIQAKASFIDTENGESISNTALARESTDKKGMDDSQITGTASSYARKYALNGLFLIDDTKDADTDENHIERETKAAKVQDIEKMKITQAKINVLAHDIESGVIKRDDLLNYFKVEKLEDITEGQFRNYVEQKSKKEKK